MHKKWIIAVAATLLAVFLAGCNLPRSEENTTTATLNVTQAYETIEARLTEAVGQTPAVTETPAPTDSGVASPAPTSPEGAVTQTALPTNAPTASARPTEICDRAAAGNPIDVTIPDDTEMNPGQTFTKVWRLENVGTCTWSDDYEVVFFSGEAMNAPAHFRLDQRVEPGASVDISVEMVAPEEAGTYQGNWKLRNEQGATFGIGPTGNAPFWVRIEVKAGPTSTPTITATPTGATPTASATPPAAISGSITILPGDSLDLDTIQANSAGADLSYETNADAQHLLVPQNGAAVKIFGSTEPSVSECRSATLVDSPVTLELLNTGTYLCYRTDSGLPGRVRIANFNLDTYAVTLDVNTWTTP